MELKMQAIISYKNDDGFIQVAQMFLTFVQRLFYELGEKTWNENSFLILFCLVYKTMVLEFYKKINKPE